ncbi:MAG: serine hydrolase domain-containing protein [Acidimicrobiia bacterium]
MTRRITSLVAVLVIGTAACSSAAEDPTTTTEVLSANTSETSTTHGSPDTTSSSTTTLTTPDTSSTTSTPPQASAPSSLDAIVNARYKSGAGAVIVGVFEGAQSFVAAAGLDGDGQAVAADRPWTTASMAKVFTAATTMQLVEDGEIALDDPVANYVDFPISQEITVRHLLEHKSTIPSMFSHINACTDQATLDEVVDLAGQPQLTEPGQAVAYSNTNFLLLGLIIGSVTGQDPGEYIDEKIFTPLGMEDTYWFESQQGQSPWWPRPAATQGVALFDCGELGQTIGTDGAAVTTIQDMDRFYRGLFGNEVVADQTLETMLEMSSGIFGFRYGLGLLEMVNDSYPDDVLYGFGGDGLFYKTAAFYDPAKDRTVAVFTSIGEQQSLLWQAIGWANSQP